MTSRSGNGIRPLYEVYSTQLFSAGHGFPLWDGQPEDDVHEVEIGTVGRVDQGKFWMLFNAMKESDDPCQKHGVPSHFERLSAKLKIQGPWEKIKSPLVSSKTVFNRDIQVSADTSASLAGLCSAGAGLKFMSSQESGAFLFLETPATAHIILSKRRVVTYLREHFDRWMEFANDDCGMILPQEQIYFVHGVVKTSRWACGAFQGSSRNKEVSVNAQVLSLGNLSVSISINSEDAARVDYNYGPFRSHGTHVPSITESIEPREVEAAPKQDQCVFFNYFKAKRRLWLGLKVIEAAAGPHELPPDYRGGASPSDPISVDNTSYDSDDFEEMPPAEAPYDPVDSLLDYILAVGVKNFFPLSVTNMSVFKHSEAEIAIASDTDLYALFYNMEFPSDVETALEELKPTIEVDEDRAGTVAVSHHVFAEQTPPVAGITASPAARKDAPNSRPPSDVQALSPIDATVEARAEGAPTVSVAEPLSNANIAPRAGAQADPADQAESLLAPTRETPPELPDDSAGLARHSSTVSYTERSAFTEEEVRRRREQKLPAALPGRAATEGHIGAVTSFAYSHDSKWLATGSEDTTIVLWNSSDQTIARKWEAHADVVRVLAFSPDNKRLASGGADNVIHIWAVETGEQLATLDGHEGAVQAMAWSSDGKHIASGSGDATVRLWDGVTYAPLSVLEDHEALITYVTFSRDDRWLASCSMDHCCRIWDVAAGTLHRTLEGHKNMVWCAEFDEEARRIVTCSDDASVRIWSAETGEMLVGLYEHRGPVWSAAFAPGGKTVLTASSDGTMTVCDSFMGERRLTFEGHEGMINAACFSPDGKYVASAASDNTVRLWSAVDGALVATFNEHEDKVTFVRLSPDGKTLASASDDGTVRIRALNEWNPDRMGQDDEIKDEG
ncbi:WD40-repeat-containing domain protein [Trametes maxima]|nr:WD40-repeat-containing domain protein [Trametes maxima]